MVKRTRMKIKRFTKLSGTLQVNDKRETSGRVEQGGAALKLGTSQTAKYHTRMRNLAIYCVWKGDCILSNQKQLMLDW
jgi:hypothetical protein